MLVLVLVLDALEVLVLVQEAAVLVLVQEAAALVLVLALGSKTTCSLPRGVVRPPSL